MSDALPCPECDAEVAVGSFPVFEGDLAPCHACDILLVVQVDDTGDDDPDMGGRAYLVLRECEECEGVDARCGCGHCRGLGLERVPPELRKPETGRGAGRREVVSWR